MRVSVRAHTHTHARDFSSISSPRLLDPPPPPLLSSSFRLVALHFSTVVFPRSTNFGGVVPSFVTSRGYLPSALVDVDGDNHASAMLETALMAKRRAIPPYRSFPASVSVFSPRSSKNREQPFPSNFPEFEYKIRTIFFI